MQHTYIYTEGRGGGRKKKEEKRGKSMSFCMVVAWPESQLFGIEGRGITSSCSGQPGLHFSTLYQNTERQASKQGREAVEVVGSESDSDDAQCFDELIIVLSTFD